MGYIEIAHEFPLRDMNRGGNGKGHLHGILGYVPRDSFIVRSQDHGYIIQLVLSPGGKATIGQFFMKNNIIRKLSEQVIYLS